ncbi:trehalose-phosphatase [Vairimorpha apis BRL 01]|uniref:Trehalose-phosphatase n=1 Tax=Vairimorpha apis BRL 01 TaxID=1037528 RepID=T0MGA7_9MICR|nr:trehalose-phosphatase [Vairimorpha apis BRL 01]
MKKYILSTEIIYYVSRLNEQDAFHVLTNGRLKQTNSTTKSSKTNTKYENALDDINIYTKPLYLCPSYIHDTQFIYIGLVDIDFTIKPSDFSQIESMLESYNIIPIFEPLLKYRQIYIDILNSNTFYYTTQDLNHLKYFEQYKYLNDLIYDKLKDIVNDDTDLVWSQDLTFALTASKFKNGIQDIYKFNELIWCVPFFENFLEQFLNCKTLNFYEKNDIEIFERVVKQFYFDKKPVLPNLNFLNVVLIYIEIYKENVINSIFHSSNIEYKGKNITPREIKYIDAFKYKKVINEKDLNDKYLRDNNDSTLKSRLVEPLKINSTTDWMCQILNRTINTIILDYDGTLVNICENPEDAVISDDVKNILTNLNKYIKVVISTGRTRECMDKLIPSDLEVFAEHCTFKRVDGKWEQLDKFNISKIKCLHQV